MYHLSKTRWWIAATSPCRPRVFATYYAVSKHATLSIGTRQRCLHPAISFVLNCVQNCQRAWRDSIKDHSVSMPPDAPENKDGACCEVLQSHCEGSSHTLARNTSHNQTHACFHVLENNRSGLMWCHNGMWWSKLVTFNRRRVHGCNSICLKPEGQTTTK